MNVALQSVFEGVQTGSCIDMTALLNPLLAHAVTVCALPERAPTRPSKVDLVDDAPQTTERAIVRVPDPDPFNLGPQGYLDEAVERYDKR